MIEYGRRRKRLPAPMHVVWHDLAHPRLEGIRVWLILLPDEVLPKLLDHNAPNRVEWSSLWPDRPDDKVLLQLEEGSCGDTVLTFTLLAAGEPPDVETSRRIAKRMSYLLYANLRFSYGQ